jgi:biotin carboxyl carrier protein
VKLRLFHKGEAFEMDVGSPGAAREVRLSEIHYEVFEIASGDSAGAVVVNGRPVRYLVERDGGRIRVAVRGESYDFDLTPDRGTGRAARGTASPETLSPMPGKVLAVMTEVGRAVKPGDPLLILEAMKMENVLAAELAGTVAEVRVQAGEMVEPGKVLVVIRPDPQQH